MTNAAVITPPAVVADTLEIWVNLADIQAGMQGVSDHCPVALALHRAGYGHVQVGNFIVEVDDRKYACGDELTRWIRRYDADGTAEPERFVVRRIAA